MAGVSKVRPGFVTPVKAVHPDEALHKTLQEAAPEAGDASNQRQLQQAQSSFGGGPARVGALQLVPPQAANVPPPPSPLPDPSQSSYTASNLSQATPALAQIGKLAQQGPLPQLLPSAPVSQVHAGAPSDLKPTQLVAGASQLSNLSADVQRQMRMQIAA